MELVAITAWVLSSEPLPAAQGHGLHRGDAQQAHGQYHHRDHHFDQSDTARMAPHRGGVRTTDHQQAPLATVTTPLINTVRHRWWLDLVTCSCCWVSIMPEGL
jgi:hypothetical protein